MKKFFLWVFVTLLVEGLLAWWLMYYYKTIGFNDIGVEEDYIVKNPVEIEQDDLWDIDLTNSQDFKIETIDGVGYKLVETKNDIKEFIITEKNLESLYLENKLASIKDKRIQNFVYNFFYFNGKSEFKSFLFEKYKENLNFDSEELKTLKIDDEEKFYKDFFQKTKTLEDARKALSNISLEKYKNDEYCLSKYCETGSKEINKIYKLTEKAFGVEKKLYTYIQDDYKKYGFNPKIYYSIIMTENMRMYSTYKGQLKNALKSALPPLPIMTQFSYGIFAVKNNLITRMVNENYEGSKFYIGWEDEIFKNIRDNYYYYNKNSKRYSIKNEQGLINYITKNKDVQVRITTLYFLMQQAAWKPFISDFNNNAGILTTLYNIGAFKEPHGEPKLWGANLAFLGTTMSFGKISEQMVYSTNFDYLMYQLSTQ